MPMHACGAVCVRRFRVRPLSKGTWWVDGAVGWFRPNFFKLLCAVARKKSHRAYLLIGKIYGVHWALDGKCSTANVGLESLSEIALPPPRPCMPVLLSVSGGFGIGPYQKARGGSSRPNFVFTFTFVCSRKQKVPQGLPSDWSRRPSKKFDWLVFTVRLHLPY